ncbi:MAG: extracellular solute-binding protein [Ghiorsea sp.]|nr:extracellular solute-binding protein [Ghiorsea sp.]
MVLNRRCVKIRQVLFIFVSLCLCGSFSYAQESITVAVASSFYAKTQQISEAFEAKHDIKIRLVSGSTGRLYNQIKQGAPFDIFIAADIERPALLARQHKQIAQGFVGLKIKGQASQRPQ